MVTNTDNNWAVRLATLVLWLLAGGSAVYWGLRLSAPVQGAPVPAVAAPLPAPDAQALARLLGAVDPQAPAALPLASVIDSVPVGGVVVPAPVAPALGRVLGGVGPDAAAALPLASVVSRFALVGVLAGRSSGTGAALIAVDSRPAKPFRVGAQVDAGLVLQSVGQRQARLGAALRSPTLVTLEVPARAGKP